MSDLGGKPFVRISLLEVQRDNEALWECTWTNVAWHSAGFHQEASSITTITGSREGVLDLLQDELGKRAPNEHWVILMNGVEVPVSNVIAEARAIMRMDEGAGAK